MIFTLTIGVLNQLTTTVISLKYALYMNPTSNITLHYLTSNIEIAPFDYRLFLRFFPQFNLYIKKLLEVT